MKKNGFLLLTFSLIFILPLLGSLAKWKGLPPGYGEFLAHEAPSVPGFSLGYFVFGVLVAIAITMVFAFPRLFGFARRQSAPQVSPAASYPVWFWWSLPVLGLSWFLMWTGQDFFRPVQPYMFVPLWWSFIFLLDGIVYKRNGGASLVSRKPATMQLLAVVSCFSWFAFEYLNFFVLENWYYPNNHIFSNFGNIFWFSLSYTTVLPAIIEWYLLLQTIPFFKNRYSHGPKWSISPKWLTAFYGLGLVLAFSMGYFPFYLFWVLWVALVPLLSAAMGLTGYWTPFTPIKEGNWSPLLLIALATVCNGFFWELWNYGSGWFHEGAPTNANFWKYSVPYLDTIHLFSEMPLLGYFGYLFFGANCWIIWLTAAYVFKFDASFEVDGQSRIRRAVNTTFAQAASTRYERIEAVSSYGARALYRCEDHLDGSTVLVTALEAASSSYEEVVQFKEEYRLLLALSGSVEGVAHPIKLEETGGYFTMQIEDEQGELLQAILAEQQVELEDQQHLAAEITGIVAAIHDLHVVHPNLDPRTILWNRATGQVRLTDFHTAARLSPESAGKARRSPDYRSDLYALGVILYEIFTGIKPHLSSMFMEQNHSHRSNQPLSPYELTKGHVSEPLSDLIMRLLDGSQSDRYATAHDIKAELNRCFYPQDSYQMGGKIG